MNPTPTKLPFFLQRTALITFSLLPVAFALLSQLQYIFGNWSISLILRAALLVGILLLPLLALLVKDDLWRSIEATGYIPLLWVLLLALSLRLIVLPLFSTNFSSDMLDVHLFATDVVAGHPFANLAQYQGIPWAVHLDITGLVTSLVYRVFGASFATGKMFMLAVEELTIWLVYLAGRQLAGARVGFIAASLYGTLPALVCYTGVLSGEHIALLLITLSILLYGRIKKSEDDRLWYRIAGYVLCGIAIGLIDWFRPGGIILLTALVISDLVYLTRDKIFHKHLLPLGFLLISYFAVSNTAVFLVESFFHTDIMSAVQQSGHFILLGLNAEHKGVINNEDRAIAFEAYKRFGDDTTAANIYLVRLALDRLKGQSVLALFQSKFNLIWSNHWQLFQISLNGSDDQEIGRLLSNVDSIIYLVVTLFIGANVFFSFRNRSQPAVFCMQLFILGFAIWSLILEAQNRYAMITFPYQILLASLGLSDLVAFALQFKRQPSSSNTR